MLSRQRQSLIEALVAEAHRMHPIDGPHAPADHRPPRRRDGVLQGGAGGHGGPAGAAVCRDEGPHPGAHAPLSIRSGSHHSHTAHEPSQSKTKGKTVARGELVDTGSNSRSNLPRATGSGSVGAAAAARVLLLYPHRGGQAVRGALQETRPQRRAGPPVRCAPEAFACLLASKCPRFVG